MAGTRRTSTVGGAVEAVGLRELLRDLKALGTGAEKEIRRANKGVAEEIVLPAVRSNLAARPRVHAAERRHTYKQHWADAVQSVKALGSQRTAAVALGSARVPWAAAANFGSDGKWKQFSPRLGGGSDPLYSAIVGNLPRVLDEYGDALDRALDSVNMKEGS